MKANCPACLCYRLRPEPYRWYETVLALFAIRPFRCCRCRARFFRFAGMPILPRMLFGLGAGQGRRAA